MRSLHVFGMRWIKPDLLFAVDYRKEEVSYEEPNDMFDRLEGK